MASLRIADESELPQVDYTQPGQFTWKDFYSFRNHVIRCLRRFGSAGPTGEADLSVDDEDAPVFEKAILRDPDFFVVDDMWNDCDRISVVESTPEHVSTELIESLADMAQAFPGWYVAMRLGDCGLSVFREKVVVGGRRFWDCKTVRDLTERCSKPVGYGGNEPLSKEMYSLWLDVITGAYVSPERYGEPSSRQWRESISALQEIIRRRGERGMNPFDYARIRYDLHPMTRLECLKRFLATIDTYSVEEIIEAKSNILKDAGDMLSIELAEADPADLIREISLAQRAVADRLPPTDIALWWPYVVDYAGTINKAVKDRVVEELRSALTYPNHLMIQVSGMFALSRLRVNDISEIVDNALKKNPDWLDNAKLMKWLDDLRRGSRTYPSGDLWGIQKPET